MRLYSEIIEKSGLNELAAREKVCWVLGGGGYFQGVRTILSFSNEKIMIQCRTGEAEITGKNFIVEKYCDGDLLIKGNILMVSYKQKSSGDKK